MKRQNMENRRNKKAKRGSNESKKSAQTQSMEHDKQQSQQIPKESTGNEISERNIFEHNEPQPHTAILVTEELAEKPAPIGQDNQQVIAETNVGPETIDDVVISMKENRPNDIPSTCVNPNVDEPEEFVCPETVQRLTTYSGAEVYVIGTAHFSTKSAEDVTKLIRYVRPSVVVVELCQERAFMLSLDEASLLEQNRKLSFDKIKSAIAEKGLAQGLIYILFVKMSANLTERLGLAPGSEFRAGAKEAREIPGCIVALGDRSLRTTVARAVASMSLWQKLSLIYHVITSDVSITQEDIEKFKEKDILEQMLQELGGSFPGLKRVILDERNVYLAHSIYGWAERNVTSCGPTQVVAVVGLGHVEGIIKNWGKTREEDIIAISTIPEVSKTRRVVTKTVKYCTVALFLYLGYRAIVPSDIQTSIQDKFLSKVFNR